MSNKIGVVLSGCGVYDGSEIHESVITILALERTGADILFMAPDRDQLHVINHQTGETAEGEKRNVMVESARIARGPVTDLATVNAADIDALVFPGGFGAAKNLCDFAVKGADCEVDPDVQRLIVDMNRAGKWVVAMCIAPAMAAKALASAGVRATMTIGTDPDTAGAIETMGGKHENADVRGVVVDSENKIISTPAYMLGPEISDVAAGIENAIAELMKVLD